MKIYQLLVAPLLSVAFLASCGGGNTPSADKHAVTEQEFNDACSFKNVQYVQLSNTSSGGGSGTFNSVMELSPTVTHSYYESASYYETFVQKKTDGSYEKAIRQDKEGPYDFSVAQASDFYTPQSEYFSVLSQLEHVGLSYKSFTYDSKAGTYSATFTPQAGPETTAVLRFEDKKLISDASSGVDGNISTSIYTYESKTPEYPENPGPTPTYDEIQIPSVGGYSEATLNAVNGIIGIKITNATTISPNTDFNAASCNLSDEPSEITTSTPKVFSTVKMSYDESTEESLTYGVFNDYDKRLQYWSVNFESEPTESNIFIIIALNNDYVSSATGRTIKQNYTGEVSCSLYNESYGPSYSAGIQIDYNNITEL